MEDRNVMREMERERRNQEIQPEETNYDKITPLFSQPYKINKGDELSTRIQRMLGNFEDGCDVGPKELCSVVPFGHSVELLREDGSNLRTSSELTDGSTSTPQHVQKTDSCDSNGLPALSPPVDPLSPLQSSEIDETSPKVCPTEPSQIEPPATTHTLLLNLNCKPGSVNPKKPTAYVRPMDGQDQITNGSPELKTPPETHEHLSDPKNNIIAGPNDSLKNPSQSVTHIECAEVQRVDDILKEMTSWPELLTKIHTPSASESLPVLTEETHSFPTDKAHKLSERVDHEHQISSSSESSSSDTENEVVNLEEKSERVMSSHTRVKRNKDWQLRRWLYSRQNKQNPESLCYVIMQNSHHSPKKTEAKGQQGCYSNTTQSYIEVDRPQTITNARTPDENSQTENKNSSIRKTNKKKTENKRREVKIKTQESSFLKRQSLLVKIDLNLISRIPQKPKTAPSKRPDSQKITEHKRRVEQDDVTPQRKKLKMNKDEKLFSSSQNNIKGSKITNGFRIIKKNVKQNQTPIQRELRPPERKQKMKINHEKKPSNAPSQQTRRILMKLDCRQHSVEDHLREAKKLKHKADAMLDKMPKALGYLEAALSFAESGVAMETNTQTPKSAYTMFSETVELIRFIMKLKNYTDPTAATHERDFLVLCLRCESLLQMAMFRSRRDSALEYSRKLAELLKSSSPVSSGGSVIISQNIQQMTTSYVEVTSLFLNALETWERADDVAVGGSGLLQELDGVIGPLSLTSSISSLVKYTRHGLHWIRLEPRT